MDETSKNQLTKICHIDSLMEQCLVDLLMATG
jgi:hypothetical protein